MKNTSDYISKKSIKVVFKPLISLTKKTNNFMENVKMSDNLLSWKLVWDAETKDVLFLNQIDSDIETINELFETKNINDIYDKINELGLKYDPFKLQEEWI